MEIIKQWDGKKIYQMFILTVMMLQIKYEVFVGAAWWCEGENEIQAQEV